MLSDKGDADNERGMIEKNDRGVKRQWRKTESVPLKPEKVSA